MNNSIILHQLSPDELFDYFNNLKEQLKEIQAKISNSTPNEYISRTELAKLLDCDISTVHNLTKRGDLISYGFPKSGRVYYKRSEVEASLIQIAPKKK